MIFVKIYGGLGNQLYQYALGKSLATNASTLCKLDLREFESYKLHRYSLCHFRISEYLMEEAEYREVDDPRSKRWLRKRGKIPCVREKSQAYDPRIAQTPSHAYFDGYWQCFRYFEKIRPILEREITVKYPPSGKNMEWLKKISDVDSVALHVRRGDYATDPTTHAIHGLCPKEYYQKASRLISEHVKKPVFFVFSDDPTWVRNEFEFLEHKEFVDNNSPLFNYEDLRLISACRHQIIANSSFSWWAAWLNIHPHKRVYAPRRWYAGEECYIEDRIPSEWNLL